MLKSMKAPHELVFSLCSALIDSLAGLVTYLMVLFSVCDFFGGLDLLKGRKLSYALGHWLGQSLLLRIAQVHTKAQPS